jgi:hypothetical protein
MSFWTRERVIGLIVGVITVIITLILIALFEQREASSKVPFDCVDSTERERIRELALKGVDDGFSHAMEHLFDVWQKDPATEQPKRAQVGTGNAVNAHIRARKLVLTWNPPSCPQEK